MTEPTIHHQPPEDPLKPKSTLGLGWRLIWVCLVAGVLYAMLILPLGGALDGAPTWLWWVAGLLLFSISAWIVKIFVS